MILSKPQRTTGMNLNLDWKTILRGFNVKDTEYPLEREDVEVLVVLVGSSSTYRRGRTFGPPEMCYPSEGGYVEDVTAFNPETGEAMDLTVDEQDRASERLNDLACEKARDDYECQGDRAYDEWKDRQMEGSY